MVRGRTRGWWGKGDGGGDQELGACRGASPYVGVGRGRAMGGVRARGKQVGSGVVSECEGAWVHGGGAQNMGAWVWGVWWQRVEGGGT